MEVVRSLWLLCVWLLREFRLLSLAFALLVHFVHQGVLLIVGFPLVFKGVALQLAGFSLAVVPFSVFELDLRLRVLVGSGVCVGFCLGFVSALGSWMGLHEETLLLHLDEHIELAFHFPELSLQVAVALLEETEFLVLTLLTFSISVAVEGEVAESSRCLV